MQSPHRIVLSERDSHPPHCVLRRLLVLWSLHGGLKREQAVKIAGVAVLSAQRDVAHFCDGGLDAVLKSAQKNHPTSELAQHGAIISHSLEQRPVLTIASGSYN
ncbi:hypothetical protein [Bythopirellula polymerisocia]|uniref:Uncharacterized protein n=1 Tax=Bythopirellula polymerisocia TaxID=2528003 RepID=A0A5C6CIW2_9BACT|nr:hypothetical protein [Bythopirellula polymerisocia]TWU24723.1 hypothetical protein Pla144_36090 [Bythopirellula polymerisocia]